ncbi:MAG TPA: helix-turn-helix domain-containing protein [Ktedonobacteraceae bacterium]
MTQPDEWLSVEEVAKNLKMDEETVRKWIRRRQLKAYKFGRDYRIRREDFETFIRERAVDSE